jgi:hypothetical protein
MRRRVMRTWFWWESQKRPVGTLDVGGRIILKWMLEKYGGVVWTGFIWLSIGISGGLL